MLPLVCADDAEAIEQAKQLCGRCAIELWSGERFVTRLGATEKAGDEAVTHEIKAGRMVPKK